MEKLSINFSGAHAKRIQSALEEVLDLVDSEGEPRAATMADLKEYIIADVRQFVRTSEKRVARRAADTSVRYIDIT